MLSESERIQAHRSIHDAHEYILEEVLSTTVLSGPNKHVPAPMGALRVVVMEEGAVRVACRPNEQARKERFISLLIQFAGQTTVAFDGESLTYSPGEWGVRWGNGDFVRTSDGPGRKLACAMPLSALGDFGPKIRTLATTKFTPDFPENRLVVRFAEALSTEVETISASAFNYGQVLFDLLRVAIEETLRRETGSSAPQAALQRARRLIDRHFMDPDLSLDFIVGEMGCTKRYLHKLFAIAHTTPSVYIMDRRLAHAEALLHNPNDRLPIGEIAYRSGFNDPAYFGRVFKERFGTSPGAYRRSNEPRRL